MPAGHIDAVDTTIQTTNIWLNELDQAMGWDHRQRTYRLLRAVLHALRDRLPVNEATDLGAQLPLLIRGIYTRAGGRPRRRPSCAPSTTFSPSSTSRSPPTRSTIPKPPLTLIQWPACFPRRAGYTGAGRIRIGHGQDP
ncbi:MAG TPA: DUF2267 domain-containing protein, partial [Hyphomicrobiales bacterium]|nr:DUF2267 domain-containing protein [Hyphomicrobiales bacterium]